AGIDAAAGEPAIQSEPARPAGVRVGICGDDDYGFGGEFFAGVARDAYRSCARAARLKRGARNLISIKMFCLGVDGLRRSLSDDFSTQATAAPHLAQAAAGRRLGGLFPTRLHDNWSGCGNESGDVSLAVHGSPSPDRAGAGSIYATVGEIFVEVGR